MTPRRWCPWFSTHSSKRLAASFHTLVAQYLVAQLQFPFVWYPSVPECCVTCEETLSLWDIPKESNHKQTGPENGQDTEYHHLSTQHDQETSHNCKVFWSSHWPWSSWCFMAEAVVRNDAIHNFMVLRLGIRPWRGIWSSVRKALCVLTTGSPVLK